MMLTAQHAAIDAALDADSEEIRDERAVREDGLPKRKKKWLSGVFAKAADIAGRAAVTQAIKITAVTALAGAGASAFVSIGVAAVASGAGAALYSYGKDTYSAWRDAKRDGDDSFRWVDTERLKKARNALLFGVAGGAFGAWLAGTETFQAGLDMAKHWGGKMIESALGFFSTPALAQVAPEVSLAQAAPEVSLAQVAPDVTTLTPEQITARINDAHEAAHAAAAASAVSEDDIIARIDSAHGLLDAERRGLEVIAVPEAPKTVLGKLWDAAMTSDQAKGVFMAQMLKADPDNLASVTPQFLKDRAHDVLRLTDLPWQERLSLARELAEEAQARGNRQAAGFLRDLAKLEDGTWKPRGLNIDGAAAPKAVPDVSAPEVKAVPEAAPQPEAKPLTQITLPEEQPIKTVILEADPVTGEVQERVVDAIRGEGLRIEPVTEGAALPDAAPDTSIEQPAVEPRTEKTMLEKPAAAFERAAVCTVTMAGDLSAAETFCEVSKPSMKPGDYISFVAAGNVHINVATSLVEGSVDVPTQSFLHEKVIGDGVARLASAAKMAPR